jgi:hypothetical protein
MVAHLCWLQIIGLWNLIELNNLIGKLDKWAFHILHAYDYDIVHMVGKVNWNVDGLIWSPSCNEEDPIETCCHNGVDLEVILKWHILTYLCTMLRCFEVVFQINMGNEDSHDTNIESKIYALDIYDGAHVITYL